MDSKISELDIGAEHQEHSSPAVSTSPTNMSPGQPVSTATKDGGPQKSEAGVSLLRDLALDAEVADTMQKNMSIREAVRKYPKAIAYSMVLSLCIIMEGYDTSLIGSFFALPQFRKKFGVLLDNGDYQVTASWMSGLQNGTQVGQICGLMVAGILADRFGYKKTIIGALFLTIAFIFIFFFAQNIAMLFAGGVLCGLPWGAFQILTTTYAADVAPIQLRPILTTYVNMCWVIGQLISTGTLRGLLNRSDDWAWRIPYAIQWVFPPPIILGVLFAPESPTWLVKKGRLEEARKALRGLTSSEVDDEEISQTVAMIAHTNELEMQLQEGTSYLDCLRGPNLRRTEIASVVWMTQVLCGIWFGGNITYFLQQAGFNPDRSFDFGIGTNGIALAGTIASWFVMPHVGRRTLYLVGLSVMFSILVIVGILGIPAPQPWIGWASGGFMMVFVATYGVTVGPVCYCIVSEIPSTRLRIKSVVLARNAYNITSIVANFLNPPILNPSAWNLRGKGGFVWCGFCLSVLIWSYFRLPEPKGLSAAELDILFEDGVSARNFRKVEVDAFARGNMKAEEDARVTDTRGPKGPRPATGCRIKTFQRDLEKANPPSRDHPTLTSTQQQPPDASLDLLTQPLAPPPAPSLHQVPLSDYLKFLEIFRHRLYPVWPIVSCDDLISRLRADSQDFEAYALAGALCAAVISQLRLPENVASFLPVSSRHFQMEAERLRILFDYRDHYSIASLLTSFFLHIYFANINKLQTAGLYLREAIAYTHGLALHQPETYASLTDTSEHQLRLRVYWILFISERTFCVQNGLPATLNPIDELPTPDLDTHFDSTPVPAFLALTRLFLYLKSRFITHPLSDQSEAVSEDQKKEISMFQHNLKLIADERSLNEMQYVDIFATRNWIRTLLWQYSIVNFPVSCHADDDAFSALLPASIAKEMLSVITTVSNWSIRAHGYGMVRAQDLPDGGFALRRSPVRTFGV
ncbi:hypothetical protein V498_10571 [Pseudogymnoascus sp. VKM F-4517 (FW-2822)]|nr:hypothetical protein V498_10571 [Pseudogymnoascus sp. VKM F-4517 (FW-2822)]